MANEGVLTEKSKAFALNIIHMCRGIRGSNYALMNQVLRSGTSIGANVHEANFAYSKSDFAAKMQIALKECNETEYWLDLLLSSKIISENYQQLLRDCRELKRMLIASCKTVKQGAN